MPVVATKSKVRNHSARARKAVSRVRVVREESPPELDHVVMFKNIPWETYLTLDEQNERRSVKLTYLNGSLEIMTISHLHELIKSNLDYMIAAFCERNEIAHYSQGSLTRKIEDVCAGEADESYCFGEEKEVPDVVLEVALSSGGLNKLQFYKALGVSEVWIWRKEKVEIWQLVHDNYTQVSKSRFLPDLNMKLLVEFATEKPVFIMLREFRKRQFPS